MTAYVQLKEKIDKLTKELPEKTVREYRIEFLGHLAARASSFSAKGCSYCTKIEENLDRYVNFLLSESTMPEKRSQDFFEFISTATRHMMSEHRLVAPRQYLVSVLPVCLILGLITGWFLENIGLGALCGVAAGILFGIFMDVRAQRKNRVI